MLRSSSICPPLAILVSLLGSLRFAILGATRRVVARGCFRISLKWRVLACEGLSRHKQKKALKAGKVTGPIRPHSHNTFKRRPSLSAVRQRRWQQFCPQKEQGGLHSDPLCVPTDPVVKGCLTAAVCPFQNHN